MILNIVENLKQRNNLEDLDIDRHIIQNWILKKVRWEGVKWIQ
jgi:hypothetical protein